MQCQWSARNNLLGAGRASNAPRNSWPRDWSRCPRVPGRVRPRQDRHALQTWEIRAHRLRQEGSFDKVSVDCPFVFRHQGAHYMTFVAFDGIGYQTGLASSPDLVNWKKEGCILKRDPSSSDPEIQCGDELDSAGERAVFTGRTEARWVDTIWARIMPTRMQGSSREPPSSVSAAAKTCATG